LTFRRVCLQASSPTQETAGPRLHARQPCFSDPSVCFEHTPISPQGERPQVKVGPPICSARTDFSGCPGLAWTLTERSPPGLPPLLLWPLLPTSVSDGAPARLLSPTCSCCFPPRTRNAAFPARNAAFSASSTATPCNNPTSSAWLTRFRVERLGARGGAASPGISREHWTSERVHDNDRQAFFPTSDAPPGPSTHFTHFSHGLLLRSSSGATAAGPLSCLLPCRRPSPMMASRTIFSPAAEAPSAARRRAGSVAAITLHPILI